MKRLLGLAFPLLVAGCLGKSAATSSVNAKQNLASARDALVAAGGYKCKSVADTKVSLVCEQEDPHVKFIFGFEELPARMVVVLVFNYPSQCDPQRILRINLFNSRTDYAHASCEGKNIFYFGSQAIPERGLTAKDVVEYVHWWTTATIRAGAAAGLFEPGGDAPPSGADGSKT